MEFKKLREYGADDYFINKACGNIPLGRVISQYSDIYRVVSCEGEKLCKVSGKFIYSGNDYPAVGDFVLVDEVIHKVLDRKSVFKRGGNGNRVIATNIDLAFVCTSLNQNYNLNRIERYISLLLDGGITPIIVLTKSDLCEDLEDKLLEVQNTFVGIDVIVTSNKQKESYNKVYNYLKKGMTACFVGSSGVGKSTFINHLVGEERMKVNEISSYDKGRHTTTTKELIVLKNGGIVIDTPGMREVSVEFSNIDKGFSDIEEMSLKCKFKDCTHTTEPKCFIKEAIENGSLDIRRFESYQKLKKESLYDSLSFRERENKKVEIMFKEFGGVKNAKKFIKNKGKR